MADTEPKDTPIEPAAENNAAEPTEQAKVQQTQSTAAANAAKAAVKLEKKESWWETVKTVVYALLLAVVFRAFAYEAFNIPSESMVPTLQVGDYLFVSKSSYGYSKYSFPGGFVPIEGRLFEGAPERGDVAVFRLPQDTSIDYIKRIIGLPGDRIQVLDGRLFINGKEVEREFVEVKEYLDRFGATRKVKVYRETLENGVSYLTYDENPYSEADFTRVFRVPEGHYFAMGDNRDNSLDSRLTVGYIPKENLIGKAKIIFFSIEDGGSIWQLWNWPTDARWSRFFSTVE